MPKVTDPSTTLVRNELVEDIEDGRAQVGSSRDFDGKKLKQSDLLNEFMVMLSVCHTVIPEKVDGNIIYHAASPGNYSNNYYQIHVKLNDIIQ